VYYGRLALASRVRRGNCLPERSFFSNSEVKHWRGSYCFSTSRGKVGDR